MLNIELIEYLGLLQTNKKQSPVQSPTNSLNEKNSKKLFKFLSKIPVTSVIQSETLLNLSKLYELKNDPVYRKYKYIGSDYERYVNNDDFVEPDKLSKKRELKSKETGLSRSSRLLKREMKKCSIKIQKLSFGDILQSNGSLLKLRGST